MDVVFDIDGTLADATHRLHYIKQPPAELLMNPIPGFKPDWETFLSDEEVAKDDPMPATWAILEAMLFDHQNFRVIFITGRPEHSREMTWGWLTDASCPVRSACAYEWEKRKMMPHVYMRENGDRRSSHVVKREGLIRAREEGFNPELVFEDRKDDAAMWRSEGLLCCQVAEGNY